MLLIAYFLAHTWTWSPGFAASPSASAGALFTCQGEQQPGICFHSDASRLNTPAQVYPSASNCCDACASTRSNGTAWPGGAGACRAWVWIEGSSDKPSLVGQCHLFGTSVVTRSAGTAGLNCTSGFVSQPAPPQPRPNATWTVKIGEPELVLDTRGIVANLSAELRRVAHRPQKMGIVVTPEYPWEAWIGFYTSVVQVSPTLYQLYYGCTGPANATVTFLCIAVSSDGISFTKPLDLGLYAYGNSTNNNIVWATPYELLPGGGGTNGGHGGTGWANSIVLDARPGVPASQRFKMTYDTDTSPFTPRQLLVASSPDGVHWNQLLMASTADGSLVPTAEFADTNTCLLWVPRLQRYVAFGRIDAGSPGAVCHAGSNFRRVGVLLEGGPQATNDSTPFSNRDFSRSEPTAVFFNEVGRDPGCVDFYNPAAIDVHGVTLIFPSATLHLAQPHSAGFPNPYDTCRTTNDALLDVRMAFSRMQAGEPALFEALSTAPTVPRGMGRRSPLTGIADQGSAEWDAGMVFMGTGMVHIASEPAHATQYYFGSQFTHGFEAYHLGQQFPQAKRALGRLKWRREGFVSVSTSFDAEHGQTATNGTLLTRPILLPPEALAEAGSVIELALNVETSVSGHVNVSVLHGGTGAPIEGYNMSLPLVGSDVRAPVVWRALLSPPTGFNFSCETENDPSRMPPLGSVRLETDVAPAFRAAGSAGLRLQIAMQDAELYSIVFQKADHSFGASP